MEVFSFFYSDKKIVKVLDNFLSNYQFLKLDGEDENTKYFENIETKRNEIYFHFIFKDIEHEFLINYSNSERNIIKNFYNNNQFYTFDIQFKNEKFLFKLLKDFYIYLEKTKQINIDKVLIYHSLTSVLSPLNQFCMLKL